jgi:capsular polysaccharide biosynthesis protein
MSEGPQGTYSEYIFVTWPDTRRFLLRVTPWALLVGVLLGVGVLMLSLHVMPVRYQADAALAIASSNSATDPVSALAAATARPLSINAYRTAATSDAVLRPALQSVDGTPPTQEAIASLRAGLRAHPSIQESVANDVLVIDVSSSQAARAAHLADAVTRSLMDWDKARADRLVAENVASLKQQVRTLDSTLRAGGGTTLTALRTTLQDRLDQAEALQGASLSSLSVLQSATVPTKPASPRPVLYTAVAFLVGLIATYGLALLARG